MILLGCERSGTTWMSQVLSENFELDVGVRGIGKHDMYDSDEMGDFDVVCLVTHPHAWLAKYHRWTWGENGEVEHGTASSMRLEELSGQWACRTRSYVRAHQDDGKQLVRWEDAMRDPESFLNDFQLRLDLEPSWDRSPNLRLPEYVPTGYRTTPIEDPDVFRDFYLKGEFYDFLHPSRFETFTRRLMGRYWNEKLESLGYDVLSARKVEYDTDELPDERWILDRKRV